MSVECENTLPCLQKNDAIFIGYITIPTTQKEIVMNKIGVLAYILILLLVLAAVQAYNESETNKMKDEIVRLSDLNDKLSGVISGVGKRIVYFMENEKIYILMINYAKDRNEAKNASIHFPDNKLTIMPSEIIDDNTPLFKMDYRRSDRKNIFYLGNDVVESDIPF